MVSRSGDAPKEPEVTPYISGSPQDEAVSNPANVDVEKNSDDKPQVDSLEARPSDGHYGQQPPRADHGSARTGQSPLDVLTTALSRTKETSKRLHWEGSFDDYVKILEKDLAPTRNSRQRLYDMIVQEGSTTYTGTDGEKLTRWHFFDDPHTAPEGEARGPKAVFGEAADKALNEIVLFIKEAAMGGQAAKKALLLHGPPGAAKSEILMLLKEGMQRYTRTDKGAIYTFEFKGLSQIEDPETGKPIYHKDREISESQQDPLLLIPEEEREAFFASLSRGTGYHERVNAKGTLNSRSAKILEKLLEHYDGDLSEVFKNHIRVRRITFAEKGQTPMGIATYQPKDEKNQEDTELTGQPQYAIAGFYGDESDPRAYSFNAAYFTGNRGVLEMIEVLKLENTFLYPMLTATQESNVKGKNTPLQDLDILIIGHTNDHEFQKKMFDGQNEALRNRFKVIKVPYNLKVDDEKAVIEKIVRNAAGAEGVHIAPHALEALARFGVLSRLTPPTDEAGQQKGLAWKMRLYNGGGDADINNPQEEVKSLQADGRVDGEGFFGVSARFLGGIASRMVAVFREKGCVSPNEMVDYLKTALETVDETESVENVLEHLPKYHAAVQQMLEADRRRDIDTALGADDGKVEKLYEKYLDNVKRFIRNRDNGTEEKVDTEFLAEVEHAIGKPGQHGVEYRQTLMNLISSKAVDKEEFDWRAETPLLRGLREMVRRDMRKVTGGTLAALSREQLDGKVDQGRRDAFVEALAKKDYCSSCAEELMEEGIADEGERTEQQQRAR